MKSTGVVRKVDELGRIVVPIELRRTLEIFVEGDQIVLKKYHPAYIFCENIDDVISYKGKMICKDCLRELKNQSI